MEKSWDHVHQVYRNYLISKINNNLEDRNLSIFENIEEKYLGDEIVNTRRDGEWANPLSSYFCTFFIVRLPWKLRPHVLITLKNTPIWQITIHLKVCGEIG